MDPSLVECPELNPFGDGTGPNRRLTSRTSFPNSFPETERTTTPLSDLPSTPLSDDRGEATTGDVVGFTECPYSKLHLSRDGNGNLERQIPLPAE